MGVGVRVIGIGVWVAVGVTVPTVDVGSGVGDGVAVGDDVGVTSNDGVSVGVTALGVVGVGVTSVGAGVPVEMTSTVADGVNVSIGADVGDAVGVGSGGGHPPKQAHTKPTSTTTAANAVTSIFKTDLGLGIASSKAMTNSLVLWNLSLLSFFRAFRTTCSKSGEMSGLISEGGAGSLWITAARVWLVVFSLKAAFPVIISYRTTPREKMSER